MDERRSIFSSFLLKKAKKEGEIENKKIGKITHMPTKAKEVYDVTGAGDTVIGTLAAAMASGATMQEAMILANHAAGIVVGKVGTAMCSAEELKKDLEK